MLHLIRRHTFAVDAHLLRCLALTYAFPADVLARLLPPGLAPDQYGEFGFVAIALVDTQQLRPAFLPASFGQDFFLCGYRIFTRSGSSESSLRGLYILRSDTDRRLMSYLGNAFTHYRYHFCQARFENAASGMRWTIATPGGEVDLRVTMPAGKENVRLPEGSPFPDWKTARGFAGPLPYTFDFERETNSLIAVKGSRGKWDPRPAAVVVDRATFLDDERFGGVRPVLANAFYIEDVPYHWDRGRRLSVAETDAKGTMATRRPYHGVTQILSFNRGFYGRTVVVMAVAAGAAIYAQGLWRIAILTGAGVALLWTVMSLAVSHYVYDRSPLYGLSWLKLRPDTWANVHAGLDETSEALRARFPQSRAVIWDIFDPKQMTESSMAQARECSGNATTTPVSWQDLPALAGTFDAVFLIFVAHEFQKPEARHQFLREVGRVLKPGGRVVMVEHLRDLPNLLAFGPGFLHFHSWGRWQKAFRAAELTVQSERKVTPARWLGLA